MCDGTVRKHQVVGPHAHTRHPQVEVASIDGVSVSPVVFTSEHLILETKVQKVSTRAYLPSVIEPSFGLDRIMFSVFEQVC